MGVAKYQNDGDSRTSGPGFGVTCHPEALATPFSWRRPRLVFVNSMSDLFHARVPITFVRDVFDVMRRTPQHTYQILTKRAHRLARVGADLEWPSNVWMGVSVESAEHYDRVRDLIKVPAAVRFLSCEPLLGPMADLPLIGIDWVIAGGESGRPGCDTHRARSPASGAGAPRGGPPGRTGGRRVRSRRRGCRGRRRSPRSGTRRAGRSRRVRHVKIDMDARHTGLDR